jgi:hypothetical protein
MLAFLGSRRVGCEDLPVANLLLPSDVPRAHAAQERALPLASLPDRFSVTPSVDLLLTPEPEMPAAQSALALPASLVGGGGETEAPLQGALSGSASEAGLLAPAEPQLEVERMAQLRVMAELCGQTLRYLAVASPLAVALSCLAKSVAEAMAWEALLGA